MEQGKKRQDTGGQAVRWQRLYKTQCGSLVTSKAAMLAKSLV